MDNKFAIKEPFNYPADLATFETWYNSLTVEQRQMYTQQLRDAEHRIMHKNDANFGRFISQVIFILLVIGAVIAMIWFKSVYIH